MSSRRLFTNLICAGLFLAAFVTAASAANIVANPGFETGSLAPWQALSTTAVATITVQSPDNGPSAPGTHNAFLDNRGEAIGLTMAQTTPNGSATSGTVFYSYDLKLGQAFNGGVFFVEILAQNAAGAVIGNAGLQGNYAPANWTAFSGSFVAPLNTDHLTIQFEAVTGAVIGGMSTMHVDNVDVHQISPTPTRTTSWSRIKSIYR